MDRSWPGTTERRSEAKLTVKLALRTLLRRQGRMALIGVLVAFGTFIIIFGGTFALSFRLHHAPAQHQERRRSRRRTGGLCRRKASTTPGKTNRTQAAVKTRNSPATPGTGR